MGRYFQLKNTRRFYLFFILLGALLVSCSKDDARIPAPGSGQEPALKLQRVSWSENDFQLFEYNMEGLLSRYTSQWIYIMDDSIALKKVVTNFTYTADKKLLSSETGGLITKYYYAGNDLDKTEEYDHHNRLVITHYYHFDDNKKLKEAHTVITDPLEGSKITGELKNTYAYDSQGNVTEKKEYVKKPAAFLS